MAQNWLIPVNGSDSSLKSIAWVIEHVADLKTTPTLHLLNVQPTFPNDIGRFIEPKQLKEFHREEGLKALYHAEHRLKEAGLNPQSHVSVGESAETIVSYAENLQCNQIVIGTRGHTGLGGTLLGSVASKVAHLTKVPLLLVR